ncbi:WD40-repeat-containing domain protein [Phlyctochytrium arcticum]|nr:WD40-repeat-containing domain protein [Phlyctochytrium arcticum]
MSQRLPVHKLLHLRRSEGDAVALAFGNQLTILDSRTGKAIFTPKEPLATPIRCLAYHPESSLIAVSTESKELLVWDFARGERVSQRTAIKRANCLDFTRDGKKVLCGDKFGDVYSISAIDSNEKEGLILGHVSMLTAMTLAPEGNFLLTADRDEKIRVSKYPLAFDIVEFCLGHTDFVSSLHIPYGSKTLLSGGGDNEIFVWSYLEGKLLQKLPLGHIPKTEKIAIVRITSCNVNRTVAVAVEGKSEVYLFQSPADAAQPLQALLPLSTPRPVLDVLFDADGKLWVALEPAQEGEVVGIGKYYDGQYHYHPDEVAISEFNGQFSATVEKLPDFHTTSKLRKMAADELQLRHDNKRKSDKESAAAEPKAKKVMA